jgi:hypothetical protein
MIAMRVSTLSLLVASSVALGTLPTRNAARPDRLPGAAIAARGAALRGVTFAIDSTPDRLIPQSDTISAKFWSRFSATVTVAAGRGRLDVTGRSRAPVMSVAGVVLGDPLANPGDYYLFDSTGAVLVRPGNHTFSSFSFAIHTFNFSENRDGWPDWFRFPQLHPTVIDGGVSADRLQRSDIRLYWHIDRDQQTPTGRSLARGRLVIRAAQI